MIAIFFGLLRGGSVIEGVAEGVVGGVGVLDRGRRGCGWWYLISDVAGRCRLGRR